MNSIEMLSPEKCVGCLVCKKICPTNSITTEWHDGFLYPKVDSDQCVNCGKCVGTCPALNRDDVKSVDSFLTYAVQSRDKSLLRKSSSGGAFGELARFFICRGYIVYGAAIIDNIITHIRIETEEKLELILGSKYVQSSLYNSLGLITEDLKQGKKILFSGTPCQVAGIKRYLLNDFEYVIIDEQVFFVDIICHGVGAPGLWQRYIEELGGTNNVSSVTFRDKVTGWRKSSFSYNYKGETIILQEKQCGFLQCYDNNLLIRESCYDCAYKGDSRSSDITLGDCWGYTGELFKKDDKGLSILIINSNKGKEVFENIKNRIVFEKYSYDKICEKNPCIVDSIQKNDKQEAFKDKLKSESTLLDIARQLTYVPLYRRFFLSLQYRVKKFIHFLRCKS